MEVNLKLILSLVEKTKTAKTANGIVTVIYKGGSNALVSYFEKTVSGWQCVFSTDGYIGKNGVTEDKREGDIKTPLGCFSFGTAFGRPDNPGTKLLYRKLDLNDYWVDDPKSRFYNKLVNTAVVVKDWDSAEHLYTEPVYEYAVLIDHNKDCIPGKGSAVFFHYLTNGSTGGCVAVEGRFVLELIKRLDETSRIIIVRNQEDIAEY